MSTLHTFIDRTSDRGSTDGQEEVHVVARRQAAGDGSTEPGEAVLPQRDLTGPSGQHNQRHRNHRRERRHREEGVAIRADDPWCGQNQRQDP